MMRIAIIGRGLAGKLAALYISRQLPNAELIIIDPEVEGLPVIGESTVEVTAQFFKSLDLGVHLEEKHFHKYGLTYYFHLPSNSHGQAEYIQHEAPGVVRLPAFNLNRWTFDAELEQRINPLVRSITGRVQQVLFSEDPKSPHTIEIKTPEKDMIKISSDYIIDCSGRSRVLTKQFSLHKDSPYKRSSYWFRLNNFDREILTKLNVVKVKHHCFESYYVTHHFYGYGYWIWIIPMRSKTGEDMVSFGITYRPDLLGKGRLDFQSLCELLERDHPNLKRFILSGNKIDDNSYLNYMYEANKYYDSKGRWFLLGDSGFTFDPANSAGIAYLAHQIPQITSMIQKSELGQLTPCYVEAMEAHLKAQLSLQDQWSNWYEIMNDPIKMAWTLVVANMGYFHLIVPNYMSGAFLNAGVARQVGRFLPRFERGMQPPVYPFPPLLKELAKTQDREEIIHRTQALYELTVPFSYYRPDNIHRGDLISSYFYKRAQLRLKALSLLNVINKPRCWLLMVCQFSLSILDIFKSKLIKYIPWIYERHYSFTENDLSAFNPSYSFLFQRNNTPVKNNKDKKSIILSEKISVDTSLDKYEL